MKSILIIEDDPIWQHKLDEILFQFNFSNFHFCNELQEVDLYLKNQIPDLIIADILIIENYIFDILSNESFINIPILFVTASTDIELYNYTKIFSNASYLVKPFHPISVKAAIDNLIFGEKIPIEKKQYGITVRGIYNEKIFLDVNNIVSVKSEGNYCVIKTPKNQFALKTNLIKLMEALGDQMIRIHRSYIVNTKYIQKINLSKMNIKIENVILPIGRKNKTNVEEYLNLIREL
jgi:DNA-binding LytR/AlgR family response regulator